MHKACDLIGFVFDVALATTTSSRFKNHSWHCVSHWTEMHKTSQMGCVSKNIKTYIEGVLSSRV